MKILVLSLLRLGDIIQQGPLLRALRAKYPEAQIHLLLNHQFANVEKVLDGVVNKFIYFDREHIQKGLGEASYNILWSYTQVENLVKELNSENYDLALNFTHNKLSAYLLGALQIPDRRGLYQDEGRFQGLNNPWLRYFNERFSGTQKSLFHYVELLGNAFDLPLDKSPVPAKDRKKKTVLFQCLTSDQKKNWGLENFRQLKRTIDLALNDYQVKILGASFERDTLSKVFSENELLICDLSEVKSHLKEAALLVTGDTSIKHLAAQYGTPIVELALGSSDSSKTAAYSENSVVIETKVPCAPCNHSQACHQPRQFCAEDISVETVFAAVWDQLSGEKMQQKNLRKYLDRSVWELYLNKKSPEQKPDYSGAIASLYLNPAMVTFQESLPRWNADSEILKNWYEKAKQVLPAREVLATKKSFQSSDVSELIMIAQDILKSKKDEAGYFQGFIEALLTRFTHPVQIYDRVNGALLETAELLNIRESLTQQLCSLSTEGNFYAKGIGQLPQHGFEEARESLRRNQKDASL